MNTPYLLKLLASEDNDELKYQVDRWQSSGLVGQYISVFKGFSEAVEKYVSQLDFVEISEIKVDRKYGFGLKLFGGSMEIHVRLNFQRVDGFDLMAHVSLTSNPGYNNANVVIIPITKQGAILNPDSGRQADDISSDLTQNAELIISALIREAVPYYVFHKQ